jgi:hypothetical protein
VNAPAPVVVEVEHVEPLADPLTVFSARAEAMARAWKAGEILLCDAVDRVQRLAEALGLLLPIGGIGQDEVQRLMVEIFVMAQIFATVPSEGVPAAFPEDQYEGLSSTFGAACRVADTKQSRKPSDPRTDRARALMAEDISLERAFNTSAPGDVPTATGQAAEYLVREKDPARMRAWLDRHTVQERDAILQYLERRRGVK